MTPGSCHEPETEYTSVPHVWKCYPKRFLPPGSYIDARKHEPKELASIMAHIIKTPAAYHEFFRWKSLYTYHYNKYVCRLCAALNNQTMLETRTTYKEMRRWWNPDYKERCKDKTWGS
ncbi:alpha-(1,3)-fucosyltransferase C-like isoform X3 [Choristoneura fumiferana]|uniref:alpha-(1,3)-fucosyltransferase C-like isoform X3 n=1 Tax=Choristoneura fumiferana TaxID=7141 RepID=UPI003D159DD8